MFIREYLVFTEMFFVASSFTVRDLASYYEMLFSIVDYGCDSHFHKSSELEYKGKKWKREGERERELYSEYSQASIESHLIHSVRSYAMR